MIRFIVIFLLASGPTFSAEQALKPGVPTFAVAFHLNETANARAEALNKQSELGHLPFSGKLSGTIHSDEVRIGGEHLGLKGTYYDAESKSIMHVGSSIELNGPKFSFTNLPPGDYLISLHVQGSNIYTKRISLPLPEAEANDFKVEISKATEVSGKVENMPVWALESPLAGIGSTLSVIDKSGSFKMVSYSGPSEKLVVKVRFSNPYQKDWDQPLYRYEFQSDRNSSTQTIRLPEIGDWKVVDAKIRFSDDLPAGLKPVLQNVSVTATSMDGKLRYRCNPDLEGKFILIGLPDGEYVLEVDDFGNPPFITDQVKVIVKNHVSVISSIDFVLHTHGDKK